MSLTPNEARKVYDELALIASEAGLTWLVADVSVEISLGKQSVQKIKTETTQYAEGKEYAPKRKGQPASFVITAAYSENEQLRLLVEALEAASAGTTIAIAHVFDRVLRSKAQTIEKMSFVPDGERRETLTVDRSIFERKENAIKLLLLLRELKEAI